MKYPFKGGIKEMKKVEAKQDRYNGYTSKQLNKIFYYEDGELYWRMIAPHRTKCKAHVPAKENSIMYKNKVFYKQFLIFFLAHGYLPYEIEYIDGDTTNHRVENLRAKDYRIQKSSKHVGIYWNRFRGKWIAQITKLSDGVLKYLWSASFTTEEEAIDALNNPFKFPMKPKGIRKAQWGNKNWVLNFKKLNNKYEYIGEYKTYEKALEVYNKTYEEYYGISWEQEVREQLKKMNPSYAVPLGETIPLFDDTIIAKAQKTEKEKEKEADRIQLEMRGMPEKEWREYIAALKIEEQEQEIKEEAAVIQPLNEKEYVVALKKSLRPKLEIKRLEGEELREQLVKQNEEKKAKDDFRKIICEAEDQQREGKTDGGKNMIWWMKQARDFMKKPTTRLYGDMVEIPDQLDQLIKQNEQQYEQQLKEDSTMATEKLERNTKEGSTEFLIKYIIENIEESVNFLKSKEPRDYIAYEHVIDRAQKDLSKLKGIVVLLKD